ncbi:MAG TPA: hypothetical protein VFC85_04935 [Verrucomicrobiae bacterium]|nr:hypothetical protein [Verrucomicrobiae bacterium]
MIGRATFFLLAAFWVTMNVLLWRTEYSPGGGHISIPVDLVWRKILTAPDASSLNVYQNGQRTGFFEFSTASSRPWPSWTKTCRHRKASSPAPATKSISTAI